MDGEQVFYVSDPKMILSPTMSGKYRDPEVLLTAAIGYFEWVQESPLYEFKIVQDQGIPVEKKVPLKRAMSIAGLCLRLGITTVTWRTYRKVPELSRAIEYIEEVIRTQKFEGAAAGQLNSSIISRDLGLVDRKELSGADGGPIRVHTTIDASKLSSSALAELLALQDEAAESDDGGLPSD
jgi:hypothetical protein